MKYLLFLVLLMSLEACNEEPFTPILGLEQIEGVWVANWSVGTQGQRDLINIKFTAVNRTGQLQDVPFNNFGYREGEVIFRYLELSTRQDDLLEGEMLVKYEDPSRNAWIPVSIQEYYPSLLVFNECNNCSNPNLLLERQ